MKRESSAITEWLDKHGSPEIEEQVNRELEHIDLSAKLSGIIKAYCKIHKLKFIKYFDRGFIARQLVHVRAGMKVLPGTDKYEHMDIRKIGTRYTYTHFLIYKDGDIVDNGQIDFNN